MKGKVILLSSVVLLILFAVAPVMACTSVPASCLTVWYAAPAPTVTATYTTPSGFTITVGTVNVYAILTIDSTSYYIYSVNTYYEIASPTGTSYIHYDAIWYVETSPPSPAPPALPVYPPTTNGFSGCVDVLNTASEVQARIVLHGFGSFRGQTLMLSYSGPPGPAAYTWTGNDIMR